MIEEIADDQLVEFCQWFKDHYNRNESYMSAMTTCLCGYFHTYPREANKLLNRCMSLSLMEKRKNMLYLK